jgi:hypothetical protein
VAQQRMRLVMGLTVAGAALLACGVVLVLVGSILRLNSPHDGQGFVRAGEAVAICGLAFGVGLLVVLIIDVANRAGRGGQGRSRKGSGPRPVSGGLIPLPSPQTGPAEPRQEPVVELKLASRYPRPDHSDNRWQPDAGNGSYLHPDNGPDPRAGGIWSHGPAYVWSPRNDWDGSGEGGWSPAEADDWAGDGRGGWDPPGPADWGQGGQQDQREWAAAGQAGWGPAGQGGWGPPGQDGWGGGGQQQWAPDGQGGWVRAGQGGWGPAGQGDWGQGGQQDQQEWAAAAQDGWARDGLGDWGRAGQGDWGQGGQQDQQEWAAAGQGGWGPPGQDGWDRAGQEQWAPDGQGGWVRAGQGGWGPAGQGGWGDGGRPGWAPAGQGDLTSDGRPGWAPAGQGGSGGGGRPEWAPAGQGDLNSGGRPEWAPAGHGGWATGGDDGWGFAQPAASHVDPAAPGEPARTPAPSGEKPESVDGPRLTDVAGPEPTQHAPRATPSESAPDIAVTKPARSDDGALDDTTPLPVIIDTSPPGPKAAEDEPHPAGQPVENQSAPFSVFEPAPKKSVFEPGPKRPVFEPGPEAPERDRGSARGAPPGDADRRAKADPLPAETQAKLEQIKDLYLTAEAIGEDALVKHFDQLSQRQRSLIGEFFERAGLGPSRTSARLSGDSADDGASPPSGESTQDSASLPG